jgi:two-component system chemotaxis response regulator CheB
MKPHDIIVIGGSAGALDVLFQLVAGLPADLPAAVFVVIHTYPRSASTLPELLSQRSPLAARHPLHGEAIRPGHIYVAPPDNHLMLTASAMEVIRGPKENGHRPAVDALFRSASMSHGSRVVGVVLSGYQDCGTAGMLSIKARGGLSVIQAPDSAQAPDMPRSVLSTVPVDHVVAPAELGPLLARLATKPAGAELQPDRAVSQLEGSAPGTPAEIVCPLCHGVMKEAQIGVFEHFRCHVGHTFSLDRLLREQSYEVERALWAAARALEESSAMSQRISGERSELRSRFIEKAMTQQQHAQLIRQLILHGAMSSQTGPGHE